MRARYVSTSRSCDDARPIGNYAVAFRDLYQRKHRAYFMQWFGLEGSSDSRGACAGFLLAD
eukprot:gene37170-7147_t